MPNPITRRDFVLTTAGAAMAAPLFSPAASWRRAVRPGPNGKIGLGFIGTGKRTLELIGPFLDSPEVRVLAVCDVDTTRREHAKKVVDDKYATKDCAAFIDYHELLARKDIDAVVIATPDHWHAAQGIDACKAGKDIYCEKPLTLKLREGKLMIDAARKHERVFQTGSQQRTEYDGRFITACECVRNGRIGQLISVNVGVGLSSKACDLSEEPMEKGLDWDRWLGPAPLRPYNSVLSPRGVYNHYPSWRLYWEYSGGMMTDFGAHHFDIAQYGMNTDNTDPIEVHPPLDPKSGYGARLIYPGGVEVHHGGPDGITFVGTGGIIYVNRDRLVSTPEDIVKQPLKDTDAKLPRPANHIADWLACIKSRQRPVADVEVGARSIACAHLCNLAYWHKRSLKWDPVKWEFPGDAEANTWTDYQRRKGYELPTV